jgi:hypothetical protein
MLRFLLLILVTCTLFACNLVPSTAPTPTLSPAPTATSAPTPSPTPITTPLPTPLVTEVDPEEYALFSAMIDQSVTGYQLGESVVIREQTAPHIDSLEFALEGPFDLPEELVEAYRLRNDQQYTLGLSFTLKQPYKLMPQSEYDALLRTGSASWADFEEKYPQAGGVFLFSRAGLNAARDEALVSISYYCGSLCTTGGVFLMVKEDGVWKVKQELVIWEA